MSLSGPGWFCLFSPVLLWFGGMFKITDSVKGRKNSVFCKVVRMSKMRSLKRNCFLFLPFYVGERQTQRRKTTQETSNKNSVFGWVGQKWIFLLFENLQTLFMFPRGKGHFCRHYLLWLFQALLKRTQTGVSAGTGKAQK